MMSRAECWRKNRSLDCVVESGVLKFEGSDALFGREVCKEVTPAVDDDNESRRWAGTVLLKKHSFDRR